MGGRLRVLALRAIAMSALTGKEWAALRLALDEVRSGTSRPYAVSAEQLRTWFGGYVTELASAAFRWISYLVARRSASHSLVAQGRMRMPVLAVA